MSDLPQYDSYRSNFRQTKDHVLRYGCLYSEENIGTFANLPPVSAGTQADPYRYLQELKAYSRNEEPILRKGEENCGAIGYPTAACCETQELAGQQSRKILGESCQSACCFEAIEDGNLARTSSGRARIYQEYEIPLWRSKKASGFYPSALEDHNRSRWTMAFFTDQVFSRFSRCTRARSDVRERDHEKILAFNPSIDGVFQKLLWRAYLSQPGSVIREDQRYRLGRDIVLRKPVRITFLGWCQGYDLEIDHPDHNFILASGLCCSNSHSAAYALLSYQTAWLKTHYAAAFMAAVLSSDMDKTDKVVVFMEEARSMKLTILPPAINRSEYRFTVDDQGRIIYGLGAVKGVGEAAVEAIVEERRHTGPFQDLFDLCRRVDQHKLNRRVLESLIRAGAFDGLAPNRATLMAQLPEAMRLAEQNSRADDAGQVDLFGLPTVAEPVAVASDVGVVAEWDQEQLLKGEKETLGLYLTSHPIERLKPELEHIVTHPLVDLVNDSNGLASFVRRAGRNGDKPVIIAGLVVSVRTRTANRGGRMAFVMLDDNTARLEIRVFPEAYEQSRKLLIEDAILVIQGKLVWDDFAEGLRVNVDRVLDIDTARQEYARTLVLSLDAGRFNNGLLEHLAATLAPHRQGKCQIQVDYTRTDARASIVLGQDWRVKPSEALLRELRGLVGEEKVRVVYS
ncbi:MAG: OB-fold nucleic acid binding domain-containing protein [Candidatus Competibacteraceae bacterium]